MECGRRVRGVECRGRVKVCGVWEESEVVWSVGGRRVRGVKCVRRVRGVECGRREKGPAKLVPCNT